MTLRLSSLFLLWLLPLSVAAQSAPGAGTPSARHRRAASCVAVLKADVQTLRERHASGSPGLRPEMLRLTEWGFAIIGTAYKAGLRKTEADALLAEAESSLRRLPADSQRQLSLECRAEGARLLKDANFLERALVANRARARIDELIGPEPKR